MPTGRIEGEKESVTEPAESTEVEPGEDQVEEETDDVEEPPLSVDSEEVDARDDQEVENLHDDEEVVSNRSSTRARKPATTLMYFKPGGDPMVISHVQQARKPYLIKSVSVSVPNPIIQKCCHCGVSEYDSKTSDRISSESVGTKRNLMEWIKLQVEKWKEIAELIE